MGNTISCESDCEIDIVFTSMKIVIIKKYV